MEKEPIFLRDMADNPERGRWRYLAHLPITSKTCFFLLSNGASHMIKVQSLALGELPSPAIFSLTSSVTLSFFFVDHFLIYMLI